MKVLFTRLFILPLFLTVSIGTAAAAEYEGGEARYEWRDNPLFEYAPGMSYESVEMLEQGSVQSRYPSASLSLKASGTEGQINTLTLDGGPAAHTRVALEGNVIEFGQNPVFDTSLLPLELMPRVEIYRNNFGPQGITASAGIVNYSLQSLFRENLEISLSGGSFGLWSGKALWNTKFTGGVQATWGLSYRQADNAFPYSNLYGQELRMENMDFHKVSLLQQLKSPHWKIDNSLSWKEAGTGILYSATARQEDLLLLLGAQYQATNISLQAHYAYWDNQYRDSTTDRHHNHSLKLDMERDWKTAPWSLRLNLRNNTAYLESTKVGQRWDDEILLSLLNKFKISDWIIQADLSASESLQQGPALIPGLGVGWSPLPLWGLDARLSRVFQRPSFNDLYWPEDSWSAGNPALRPETGWQVKCSLHVFLLPLRLELSWLYNNLSDMILWTDQSGKWRPENQGLTRVSSLTVSGEWKHLGKKVLWTVSGSWSWTRTLDNDPVSPWYQTTLPYSPEHKADLSLKASQKKVWGAGLHLRYTGLRYVTASHSVSLPAYLILDLNVEVLWFYISLNNLLDMRVEDVQGFAQPGRNVEAGVVFKI